MARLELGGRNKCKEQVREARAGAWLETVVQDVHYGERASQKPRLLPAGGTDAGIGQWSQSSDFQCGVRCVIVNIFGVREIVDVGVREWRNHEFAGEIEYRIHMVWTNSSEQLVHEIEGLWLKLFSPSHQRPPESSRFGWPAASVVIGMSMRLLPTMLELSMLHLFCFVSVSRDDQSFFCCCCVFFRVSGGTIPFRRK